MCCRITREVEIMKRLDHPNIIKLYEVLDTATHLCLVLEYARYGPWHLPGYHNHGGVKGRCIANEINALVELPC
jgi:serine/threonine protein kinase